MSDELQQTPFYNLHQQAGAKFVAFAGFSMPIQYAKGIKKEHIHTRTQAGLFDVSHMGQIRLSGKNIAEKLEKLVPVDIVDLPVMTQRYALFTNEKGGVLDDLMVANIGNDELFLVVNAACKEADFKHLTEHLADCNVEMIEDKALLALQGINAREVMAKISKEAAQMTFMSVKNLMLNGIECFVTCSGYTGEDGYEISVQNSDAEALAKYLLSFEQVEWVGLGARDSLRLEAGLCLYGHELTPEITPIETSLNWAISKARRVDGIRVGGFIGADSILPQMVKGTGYKRVGLQPLGKMPVRDGVELVDETDNIIGVITSGSYSPTLSAPIEMGRIKTEFTATGIKANTKIFALVRNKKVEMQIVKLPFVKQNYFRGV